MVRGKRDGLSDYVDSEDVFFLLCVGNLNNLRISLFELNYRMADLFVHLGGHQMIHPT